eukprot:TRINITY_DN2981_c0_g1_i1.p1 TRINITY_DN2981_c0_g1~~TRINITY_DN2981_c0_g1_i1.p1  ORF type:complete len:123 (-),score=1.47 TRINITY_DN2981_c0_g1_i1:44-412(-)
MCIRDSVSVLKDAAHNCYNTVFLIEICEVVVCLYSHINTHLNPLFWEPLLCYGVDTNTEVEGSQAVKTVEQGKLRVRICVLNKHEHSSSQIKKKKTRCMWCLTENKTHIVYSMCVTFTRKQL